MADSSPNLNNLESSIEGTVAKFQTWSLPVIKQSTSGGLSLKSVMET
jgi:hypothetical protein